MRLSICIQTPEVPSLLPVSLLSGTLDEKLAKAARWGSDGVEFVCVDPRRLDWDQICRALQAHGLQAAAVASGAMAFTVGVTLLHKDPQVMALARTRLLDFIDLAGALHAPVVTIGSFRGPVSALENGGQARLAEILLQAAEYAQPKGVRIAIEPINRYQTDFIYTVEQGLEFLSRNPHPALGLLIDTFHLNIEESSWTRPFELTLAQGKLFHVHLGDNNRLPPGRGLIDFRLILGALKAGSYQGYLSAELLAEPDADTAARQTLEFMRSIM